MKRIVVMSMMLCVAVAAQAARKTPDPSPSTDPVTHQVTVRWMPSFDASGREVVRLSIDYDRSAGAPVYDMLVVVARPSNRVLMRVVDPASAIAGREKSIESAGRSSALATAYAPLDHFTQTVVLPYAAGGDDRLYIGARRQGRTLVLAQMKTDLSNPVTITATTNDEPLQSPAFTRPHVIRAQTHYCYESDWCREQCIDCNSEPTITDCIPTCHDSGGGGSDDCRWYDDCPWDDYYLYSIGAPGKDAAH